MRRKITFPSVLACLSWLLLVCFAVCDLRVSNVFMWRFLLPIAVIALASTIAAVLRHKGKMGLSGSRLLCMLLLPALCICCGFELFALGLDTVSTPITDPSKYAELLPRNHTEKPLHAHFPDTIPEDAQDVRLWFNYPFLMGGERLSLCFTANEEYIAAEIDRFSSEAIWMGTHSGSTGLKNGVSFQTFDLLDEDGYTLPDDYTIYLLYSRPYKDSGDHIWNHGEVSAVVINDAENRILYQMEDW